LSRLPAVEDPNLLVGTSTSDDAAVYRLREDLCLVQTVDFFPPIVDDPYDFGTVAAVNALSDIYAMGATPILALNLVCFPEDQPKEVLFEILRGGSDVAREAGVLLVGGHTIKDKEPKYGMAVTGIAHSHSIITNDNAKPGDVLVLTKPIGTGVISTAGKNGMADEATLQGAVASMRTLNKAAAEAMVAAGAHSATDVTGFGLIGHLLTMMEASNTTAALQLSAVPVLPGTRDLLEMGMIAGGTRANWDSLGKKTQWHPDIPESEQLLLCDAQTSGGMLISIPQDRLPTLQRELADRDTEGSIIGTVQAKQGSPIQVDP
jgi:selenide,water dikinase